jgi:hypothetical protein
MTNHACQLPNGGQSLSLKVLFQLFALGRIRENFNYVLAFL